MLKGFSSVSPVPPHLSVLLIFPLKSTGKRQMINLIIRHNLSLSQNCTKIPVNNMLTIHPVYSHCTVKMDWKQLLIVQEREKRHTLMWVNSASVHSSIQLQLYFSPHVGTRTVITMRHGGGRDLSTFHVWVKEKQFQQSQTVLFKLKLTFKTHNYA